VAGARALYRLAARTGAICDHADGDALIPALRAVQDRGQYIATMGELRARAHTIVCVGTDALARYPRFFDRLGLAREDSPLRRLVFLGAAPPAVATRAVVTHLPGSGNLFADVQQLAARVARKPAPRPAGTDAALAALADELLASPYVVLLWEGGALPAHGALIVEALNRIVGTLNQTTRAATFGLGGSDGAASVNQAFTWLSGLPLRTRVSHDGLVHDPHRFGTARALADGAVDGVLWLHSFDAARMPPATPLPRIVMGPPAMASKLGVDDVFVPVAVPGLHTSAHLFRTDGPVMLHLEAPDATLMSVAQVALALLDALDGARATA
jgi:formylmethanofuran dehydrogenase subunit B